MKKNKLILILIEVLCLAICISLMIFCMPNKVPMHINVFEQIDSLWSKWFLLIGLALTILFLILCLCLKNKTAKTILKALYLITIFENLLIFAYYSLETSFTLGSIYKIPLSVLIFMPLALLIIIWANLLKNLPYKSKIGLKNKYTLETEFLWTQIHYLAKDRYFAAGFILLLMSLIFSLFRQALILFAIFVIVLITTQILIIKESKAIYLKYIEMKTRKDKQNKIKQKKNKG